MDKLLYATAKVSPCGFGQYTANQYFRHTEVQSQTCTKLTKAIWIIMFKSRNQVESVESWNTRRNTNIDKIKIANLKKPPK